MADVKWIKIVTDIFDDEKVLLIESLPECDSIIVIWFKLLCLAGKQNNSGVFSLNGSIPYTDEMFSVIFRRKPTIVQLALRTFEKFGMVEIINDTITIPNWGKHQTLDRIEAKNAYMKEYMQKYRQKQIAVISCKTNGKANVRQAEVELYKEEVDKKDIEEDKYSCKVIIDYLNLKSGTNYKHTTQKTKDIIKARINENFTTEDFKTVIDKKVTEWLNTDMAKFLRPETLFSNKFEGYLNQIVAQKPKSKYPDRTNYQD